MGRRFVFRLETVLRVRQMREEAAQREVAAKCAALARIDQLNAQSAAEIRRQQEALLQAQRQGTLRVPDLQRGHAWVAHLRREIAARAAHRQTVEQELHACRQVLREARTQTRIIEKLRERRYAEYRHDRNKVEQAAADELVRQMHGTAGAPHRMT